MEPRPRGDFSDHDPRRTELANLINWLNSDGGDEQVALLCGAARTQRIIL